MRFLCAVVFLISFKLIGQQDTVMLDTANVLSTVNFQNVNDLSISNIRQQLATPAVAANNPQLISTNQNLNLILGIAAFEGTAGTSKISYRGIGARTQYTTSRTLVYLNEIPLTSIQGFSSFEDINPAWLGSTNFYGNNPTQYPAALGGVLRYILSNPLLENSLSKSEVSTAITVGSFGLLQSNTSATIYTEKFHAFAGYENTTKQGWRENNGLKRQSLILNTSYKLKNKATLSFLAYGIKSRVEIPSSLSLNDFENNPEKAADSWANIEGFKAYNRLITGITYANAEDEQYAYSISTFYRYYQNFEARPFNILDENRHSGGLRLKLKKAAWSIGNGKASLSSFVEYQIGNELSNTFKNEFDSLSNTYNNVGAAINKNSLLGHRINSGIQMFFDTKNERLKQVHAWRFEGGVSALYQYNTLRGTENSGYSVPLILAPNLSVGYRNVKLPNLLPKVKVYRSYSIPALEENLDPNGNLNTNLQPEKAWTGEVGVDWNFNHNRFTLMANYYYTQVQNLIVPRVIGQDQVIATNSGKSQHTGLEVLLNYSSNKSSQEDNFWSMISLGGYLGTFKYLAFSDTVGSFNGNALPGFPDWQLNTSFEMYYSNRKSWFATGNRKGNNVKLITGILGRYTAGYFIDDANTVTTESYFLLQTWFRAEQNFGKYFVGSINAGIRNVSNAKYAAMTVVNNQAFGGGSPRYFYPGEPMNWFAGASVKYLFNAVKRK